VIVENFRRRWDCLPREEQVAVPSNFQTSTMSSLVFIELSSSHLSKPD